jgi:FlaA1/EpsC-like NDP-sugar epimerase
VLQAAVLGSGGEVFVLDMGEPVKILDLAKQLAELHDLELGVDLPVSFIGLRPGEKLHERLFLSDEIPQRTAHENIFVARPEGGRPELPDLMPRLRSVATTGRREDIRALLAEIVPTYKPVPSTNTRRG